MKKIILKTITFGAITAAIVLARGSTLADVNASDDQPDFPKIIFQPEDQATDKPSGLLKDDRWWSSRGIRDRSRGGRHSLQFIV